jgi:hypothetical protein
MLLLMFLQEAIGKAVASAGQRTDVATRKGITFAQLANRGGVAPFMFDTGAKRHLQQTSASYQRSDRMQMAGMAAQVGADAKLPVGFILHCRPAAAVVCQHLSF